MVLINYLELLIIPVCRSLLCYLNKGLAQKSAVSVFMFYVCVEFVSLTVKEKGFEIHAFSCD